MKLCQYCGRFEAMPRSRYCVGCEDHVYYARKEAAEDEMDGAIEAMERAQSMRDEGEDCD